MDFRNKVSGRVVHVTGDPGAFFAECARRWADFRLADWEEYVPPAPVREYRFAEHPETRIVYGAYEPGAPNEPGYCPSWGEQTGRTVVVCDLVVDGEVVGTARGIVGDITDDELMRAARAAELSNREEGEWIVSLTEGHEIIRRVKV